MPFLILLIGVAFPRLVIVLLWLFTTWLLAVDWIIGLLGFIFLPYTTLWYLVVMNLYDGVWGMWQSLILVIAIGTDLYGHFSSWRASGW